MKGWNLIMNEEILELKEEMKQREQMHNVELAFAKNGVRSIKAAMALFDMNAIKQDENGNLCDLDEHIEAFKGKNKWLFEGDVRQSMSTAMAHGRAQTKSFEKMSDEEYYRTIMKQI